MTTGTTTIITLHNLLDVDACRLINAEIQLKNVLPQWIGKTDSVKVKTMLQKYLRQVEDHIYYMETFISEEGLKLPICANKIMTALVDYADEKMSLCVNAAVRDAALLACVQSINHYKIYGYGTLAAFAAAVGLEHSLAFFRQAESNEKGIDDRLSQLATSEVNTRALAPISLVQPGK